MQYRYTIRLEQENNSALYYLLWIEVDSPKSRKLGDVN